MTSPRQTAPTALLVAFSALLVGSAALAAGPNKEVEGKTQVHVAVTTPADVAAAEAEARVKAYEGTAAQRVGVSGAEGKAQVTVHTADTLGPSYVVESVEFAVGQDPVGVIGAFEGRRNQRRVLRQGPTASVNPGYDRMRVRAVVRGVGSGEFAELNDYEFVLQGACPVALTAGKTTAVNVVIVREAPLMSDFGQGLAIECDGVALTGD